LQFLQRLRHFESLRHNSNFLVSCGLYRQSDLDIADFVWE